MQADIERLAALDSPLHRWDPRLKLATLGILTVLVAFERAGSRQAPSWEGDLPPALAALAFSILLAAAARIPPGVILRKLRGVMLLLSVILIVFPLAHDADRIRVGPIGLSRAGLLVAILMVLRALSIVVIVLVALSTTPFHAAAKALRRLHVPGRLVQTILFAYRYLLVYSDLLRRRQTALRARGFRARADLLTFRVIGNGFGGLLVGSIERTQRIQAAMKCRGFSGDLRTLDELAAGPRDFILSAIILGAGIALLLWAVL